MPTNYQRYRIPVGKGGLETKEDPKVLPTVQATELQNRIFTEWGSYATRTGYDELAQKVVRSGSDAVPARLSGAIAMGARGEELIAFDGQSCFSYVPARDVWLDKGACESVSVRFERSIKVVSEQRQPSSARNNGVTVSAWEDARGGVRYSIHDSDTGASYVHDLSLSTTGKMPRVEAIGDNLIVFFVEPGDNKIRRKRISPFDVYGSVDTSISDVVSDLRATGQCYDVCVVSSSAVLAYPQSAGHPKAGYITSNGVLAGTGSSPADPTVLTTGSYVGRTIAVAWHPTVDRVFVGYNSGSGADDMFGYLRRTEGLLIGSSEQFRTFNDTSSDQIQRCGMVWSPAAFNATDGRQCHFWWERSGSTADRHRTTYASVSEHSTGSTFDTDLTVRRMGLASRPWMVDGRCYATLAHQSTAQSTFFVVRDDGYVAVRALAGGGGGLPIRPVVPNAQSLTDGVGCIVPMTFRNRLDVESSSGSFFSEIAAVDVRLEWRATGSFQNVENEGVTYLAGGVLQAYDGQSWFEVGTHIFPEGVSGTFVSGTNGESLVAGQTYSVKLRWEWFDADGKRDLSSAVPFNITVPAGTNAMSMSVPTCTLTKKSTRFGRQDMRLAVGRTIGDASFPVFYREDDPADPVFNSTGSDTVTFVLRMADKNLKIREPDFANVEWELSPPPPCTSLEVGKDRIFIASAEDHNRVHHSKFSDPTEIAGFSDDLSFRVDDLGGDVTALQVMDDKLVVYKRDRILTVTDDGPDDVRANGGAFSLATSVTADVGCTNPGPVVEMPRGLMFVSQKGIYLLDRGLQVHYIGARVERYNGLDFVSAEVVPGTNRVLFLSSDGECLSYDYFFDSWSVFTNHRGRDAVVVGDTYHYLTADKRFFRDNPDVYTDGGQVYSSVVETPWIVPGGMLGAQWNVKRFHVTGDFRSHHQMRIEIAYNFVEEFTSLRTFDTASGSITGVGYGSGSYGSGSYGGGGENNYNFRFRPKHLRARAYRLRFEAIPDDDSPGACYELTDLHADAKPTAGQTRYRRGRIV